jgi:hypothetical protein
MDESCQTSFFLSDAPNHFAETRASLERWITVGDELQRVIEEHIQGWMHGQDEVKKLKILSDVADLAAQQCAMEEKVLRSGACRGTSDSPQLLLDAADILKRERSAREAFGVFLRERSLAHGDLRGSTRVSDPNDLEHFLREVFY